MSTNIDVAHELFNSIPNRINYSTKTRSTTAIYRDMSMTLPKSVKRVISTHDGYVFEGEIDNYKYFGKSTGENRQVIVSFVEQC